MMLAVIALVGCSSGGDSAAVSQDVAASAPPPVNPTPNLNYKELFFAHVQETVVAERTALAGTPSWTTGIASHPPVPTVTPVLGLFGTCGNKNSREPYIVSCWYGVLNGEYAAVLAGQEGLNGDPSQGYLKVYTHDLTQKEVFLTPDKAGAIKIAAIDGTLFTLTTVDHTPPITYMFDLATRQLVKATTPVLSASASDQAIPQASVIPTVDVISFQETVVAVMATMPTYTPYPHVPAVADKVLGDQRRELMQVAQRTVVAMQCITPILEPLPTPEPPLTPYLGPPTRTAGAGTIVWDGYCGTDKLIGTRNKWIEHIDTKLIGVCAGTSYTHTPHGLLLVEEYDTVTSRTLRGPDLYQVPTEVRSVMVTDAVGERLTLQADTGALFYFDVPTRQWVNP